MPSKKRSDNEDMGKKIKNVLLGIAIAVVLAFFVGYSVSTVYKAPKYDDFCENDYLDKPVRTTHNYSLCSEREELQNQQVQQCYRDDGRPRYDTDEDGCQIFRECDMCSVDYNEAREEYEIRAFIIHAIIGLAAILLGAVILKLASVSSGIMGGGILILIYSTIRYWSILEDYARIGILGIVLAILVWIGYKKLK